MEWPEIYWRLMNNEDDLLAWSALEHRVRPWARAALSRCGWHAVEDAVVDTCSSVALALAKVRNADTFAGFVYGHFLNVRRGVLQAAQAPLSPLDGVEMGEPTTEAGPNEDELVALECAFRALPARDRKAVALRYFEGLSAAEIARELGVTEGNARRIVFNGVSRLRRSLQSRRLDGRPEDGMQVAAL